MASHGTALAGQDVVLVLTIQHAVLPVIHNQNQHQDVVLVLTIQHAVRQPLIRHNQHIKGAI
jgi:hypothetical protein